VLIAQATQLPELFFPALIRAAVYENDASLNEHFVRAAYPFGRVRAAEALFDWAEHGTEFEQGHALHAVNWMLIDSTIEERPSLLGYLRGIATNPKYQTSVREKARRGYEWMTQQPFEETH
jgi:hypothetical protein